MSNYFSFSAPSANVLDDTHLTFGTIRKQTIEQNFRTVSGNDSFIMQLLYMTFVNKLELPRTKQNGAVRKLNRK